LNLADNQITGFTNGFRGKALGKECLLFTDLLLLATRRLVVMLLDRTTAWECVVSCLDLFLLAELDVSNNKLQGEIPDAIFELSLLGKNGHLYYMQDCSISPLCMGLLRLLLLMFYCS
jgi:hypothetical protein